MSKLEAARRRGEVKEAHQVQTTEPGHRHKPKKTPKKNKKTNKSLNAEQNKKKKKQNNKKKNRKNPLRTDRERCGGWASNGYHLLVFSRGCLLF